MKYVLYGCIILALLISACGDAGQPAGAGDMPARDDGQHRESSAETVTGNSYEELVASIGEDSIKEIWIDIMARANTIPEGIVVEKSAEELNAMSSEERRQYYNDLGEQKGGALNARVQEGMKIHNLSQMQWIHIVAHANQNDWRGLLAEELKAREAELRADQAE